MSKDSPTSGNNRRIGRRETLRLLAAAGVGLFGVREAASAATSTFDWRKYAGQTIRALVPKTAGVDFLEPFVPEFEKLTGIKVNWEKLGEDQQRQKLQVELTSGMADIDVYQSHTGQQGKAFMQAGWYELLEPWIKEPRYTAPDYDFADWDSNVLGQLASVDNKLVGNFEDPKKSTIVDKGYAPLPAGKGGQIPAINGWIWAMYAKSKRKEPAWYFIQWATGKAMSAQLQRYGIQQARRSAWQDPEFQKGFGAKHPDLTETMQFS